MIFKSFRIQCVIRVIVLAASISFMVYLFNSSHTGALILMVGGLVIGQIVSFIRYVEKTNRDLTRFLESIKYSDFSSSFSSRGRGRSYDYLANAFSEVIAQFHKARSEKEQQYRYLQTLVQHIGLGVMSFDSQGDIDLINRSAKRLLNISHLNNINKLQEISSELVNVLNNCKAGMKTLVKLDNGEESMTLAIHCTEFRMRDRLLKLVSMQNIESELAEQEMAAWQKLIRVLTHEIMNSITPIASLASTVHDIIEETDLEDGENTELPVDIKKDIRQAAATIEKRSKGLLHFVDAYRNLARIPRPKFGIFKFEPFLDGIIKFMRSQFDPGGIEVQLNVEPDNLQLVADNELIEQVIINLLLNAIEALSGTENPRILIEAKLNNRGRVIIAVEDNGPGFDDDIKERIFTPFFTTKKEGSGIGLSLSRQIMRLHQGSITVQSTPSEMTRFVLRF
ncbi:MAG: ATP-binding protein [candidate division Zixibacteria bacterium]